MAPCHGVYTVMLGDLNANLGWATGFRLAPAALAIVCGDFLQDTGLARCVPAVEMPTCTDGRGCVGVIDHVLHGPVPKEGHLWVDETSPFPSDHRPVVWDAQDIRDPEDRPQVLLRARHFQIRDPGITGVYHAALAAYRQERGARDRGPGASVRVLPCLNHPRRGECQRSPRRIRGTPRARGPGPSSAPGTR